MYTIWNYFKSTYSNILLLLQPLHQQIKKMQIAHEQYISHDITWVVCLFENPLFYESNRPNSLVGAYMWWDC